MTVVYYTQNSPFQEYPRLHETIDAGTAPVAIEINTFVDTILDKMARFVGDRRIFFSSFTPEICILLAIKQQAYPVFFITNIGKRPMFDKEKRAKSLQVAVRFATQWGLAGLVVAADALVMCPRLISFVKSKGLICGSYNKLNNEPENVEVCLFCVYGDFTSNHLNYSFKSRLDLTLS
jgi:glycerophosphodiester phosphodiesterase